MKCVQKLCPLKWGEMYGHIDVSKKITGSLSFHSLCNAAALCWTRMDGWNNGWQLKQQISLH